MTTIRKTLLSAGLGAMAMASIAATKAPEQSGPPTFLVALTPDASFVQGCFPAGPIPCAGPIVFVNNFNGIFGVTAAGVDAEGFAVFHLSNINWIAHMSTPTLIQGDGVYRVRSGDSPAQEITLNVTVNGQAATFTSGIVDADPEQQGINISASMNGLQNYDILLNINAGSAASLTGAAPYAGTQSNSGFIVMRAPLPDPHPYPGPQPETE